MTEAVSNTNYRVEPDFNIPTVLMTKEARVPNMKYETDACVDLYVCLEEKVVIPPRQFKILPTGIKMAIPVGYKGVIYPRSGKSSEGLVANIGTIDASYRGEIKIQLWNNTDEPQTIKHRDRVAQMGFERVWKPEFVLVDSVDETERGENGFGSTGK